MATFGNSGGATLVQTLSAALSGANQVIYTCPANTVTIFSALGTFSNVAGGTADIYMKTRRISPISGSPFYSEFYLGSFASPSVDSYLQCINSSGSTIPSGFTLLNPAIVDNSTFTLYRWLNQYVLYPGESIVTTKTGSAVSLQYSIQEFTTA